MLVFGMLKVGAANGFFTLCAKNFNQAMCQPTYLSSLPVCYSLCLLCKLENHIKLVLSHIKRNVEGADNPFTNTVSTSLHSTILPILPNV